MNTDRFKFRIWDRLAHRYLNKSKDGLIDLHPDFVVEQCTGLKDADGKLIYEGDIICGKNPEVYHEILFDHERACFRCELLPKPEHWMQNSLYRMLSPQWIKEFDKRVIGNIHENPELLEEAK